MPALFLLLSGCASIPDNVRSLPSDVSTELDHTPFFPQERYQCGPAALTTVLVASGAHASLDDIVDAVFLPGRQGSLQLELVAAARQHDRLPYVINGTLAAIKGELDAGRPVLVLQNLGIAAAPRWHYAVVVGIDVEKADVVLRSGTDRRRATSIDTFLKTWQRGDYWGIVLLRPDELPESVDRTRYVSTISALEETGRYEAASRAWRTALQRWPTNSVVLFGLANSEFRRGKPEVAEARYRELLEIDRVLETFASESERPARVFELCVFGGLTQSEIAAVLGMSVRTVKRDWRFARASLRRALNPDQYAGPTESPA